MFKVKHLIPLSFFLLLSFAPYAQFCNDAIHTGDGTFYGGVAGSSGGNCSLPVDANDFMHCAMNHTDYDGSNACGACLEVTGPDASVIVKVVDRCPECAPGDVDLTQQAFDIIGDPIQGRIPISWKYVPCPLNNNIKINFKEQNIYYTAIQFRDLKHAVSSMEYRETPTSAWTTINRENYNFFVKHGLINYPIDIRVTSILGEQLIFSNINQAPPSVEINTQQQFSTPTACTTGTTPPPTTNTPYNGTAHPIPGLVEAEHYDLGGEGVAYHDLTAGNTGNQFRTDGVDIEVTGDGSGGHNIGWTQTGEWLKYTINCTAAGTYTFSTRVAAISSPSKYKILVDGVDQTGDVMVPNTGAWQTYQTVSSPNIALTAGTHEVQFQVVAGGMNFNYWEVSAPQTAYGGTAHAIPGQVEAEHYDLGGQGVAYHDLTAGNSGGQFRNDRVDIEVTGDSYGGHNIGWTQTGEWFEYSINCSATRNYDLYARVASIYGTAKYRISLDGVAITGDIAVPNTGAWQSYQTVRTQNISIPAGNHVLRFEVVAGGFNINDWAIWVAPNARVNQQGALANLNPQRDLSIYPNPSHQQFITVEIKDLQAQANLQIFDTQGKMVKTQFLDDVSTQVDLSDLHNGVYFVRVTEGSFTATKRLVVQK